MSDLISRSALIEETESLRVTVTGLRSGKGILAEYAKHYRESFLKMIDEQPTVEAKPVVHGEWKRVGSGSLYDTYECTNCHRPPKWDCLGDNHWRIAFTDICPHCGADMRGGKND